jgi:NAD(P)-dependent dehydrogenase (short-subunit alcohol dehydrogenase family)
VLTLNKIKSYLLLVTAVFFLSSQTDLMAADTDGQKAVLITGASTGIGRNAAEALAKEGYFVYAGARKPADIEALSQIDNIMGIRLDVTVQDEIDAAVELIESQGRGLWGVVNNAGVNVIGPMIEFEESDIDFLFDVNIYGVFRVTKAFAPMIIESQGRIVNISSISGFLSGYGYGTYSMSKHAIEAFTDALTREMEDLGVKVSAVEPGNYKSRIGYTRCKRMIAENEDRQGSYYEGYWQRRMNECKEYVESGGQSTEPEPHQVSAAIQHALSSEEPKEHYLVVPRQEEAEWTIRKAFEELLSINQDHEFSYSREELIELMDDEWAYIKGEKTYED